MREAHFLSIIYKNTLGGKARRNFRHLLQVASAGERSSVLLLRAGAPVRLFQRCHDSQHCILDQNHSICESDDRSRVRISLTRATVVVTTPWSGSRPSPPLSALSSGRSR